ncbi:MAG: DNRLRE domain-containing protein [Clostridium sp.]|nr:DNRLRE domain-containing protein [Clostridium sp.]
MSLEKIIVPCIKSMTITNLEPQSNVESPTLIVGYDGENVYRSYLYFDMISIPEEAVVNFAVLQIYLKKISMHHVTTFYIQALEDKFDKISTFENQPKCNDKKVEFKIKNDAHGLISINLTSLFYNWNNNSTSNKGIIIKSQEDVKSQIAFVSNFTAHYEDIPKLYINYSLPSCRLNEKYIAVIEKKFILKFFKETFSPIINVERIIQGTFFIHNIGNDLIKAIVEVSVDSIQWVKDAETVIKVNSTNTLVAKYYGKYYRIRLKCNNKAKVDAKFIYQIHR